MIGHQYQFRRLGLRKEWVDSKPGEAIPESGLRGM